MERASSQSSTNSGVAMPATRPTNREAAGVMSPAQAVEATSPAIHPLAQGLASGLPKRMRVTANVATTAEDAESRVLSAVTGNEARGACSQSTAPATLDRKRV